MWEKPTIWSWVKKDANADWELMLTEKIESWFDKIIYAPMARDIALKLPSKINGLFGCSGYHFEMLSKIVGYFSNDNDGKFLFSREILDYHYSEVFGKLFIQLDKVGLIKKEVQSEG